jgi:Uncharacterized protein conserved in bacteria
VLLASLIFALRYQPVQTYFAQRAARYLANELQTTISLEGLYLKPFSSLVLNGLYIADRDGDTLLYANKLTASLDLWKLREQQITIKKLAVTDSRFFVKGDSNRNNLAFLIDYFRTAPTPGENRKRIKLDFRAVTLSNTSFGYKRVDRRSRNSGIDFNDIQLNGLNGEFTDIDFTNHLFKSTIKNLRFNEQSGFKVRELNTLALIDTNSIELRELYLETNRSRLRDYLRLGYDNFSSFRNFIHAVDIELNLDDARIHSKDLEFFAPKIATTRFDVTLSGTFFGKIPAINARHVTLRASDDTHLTGNFTIHGLPDINQTLFDMHLNRLSTNSHDIETLVPQLGNLPPIKLPAFFEHMGNVTYQGALRGLYHDFTANGVLETQLGTVTTDIDLNIRNGIRYSGQLLTTDFDLGTLLQQKQLGSSGFDVTINGSGFAVKDINSTVKGQVDYLDFRGYRYRNIDLGGTFAEMQFAGNVAVYDPNLRLHFDGDINFNPQFPEYAFTAEVEYANLYPLAFYRKSPVTLEHASIISNFRGNTINDIQGDIALHNVQFLTNTDRYVVDSLTLSANGNQEHRTLRIRSDLADATLHGEIDLTSLGSYFKSVAMQYAPSMDLKVGPLGKQAFDFNLELKKAAPVTALWLPKLMLPKGAFANGHFSTADNVANINLLVPKLSHGTLVIDRLIVDESAHSGALRLFLTADRISVSDSLYVNNVNLSNTLANDSLHTNLKLADVTAGNQLDFNGLISFEKGKPIKMGVLPSTLILNHEPWELDKNTSFLLDGDRFSIQDLEISNNKQVARLEGFISKKPNDKTLVTFQNFNLATFNSAMLPSGVQLRGILDGHMEISSVLKNPYLSADITAKDVYVNRTEVGDMILQANFDQVRELVNVKLETTRGGTKTLMASGTYDAAATTNQLAIEADLNQTELVLFQPFLSKLVSDISGTISADLRIAGSVTEPQVNGVCYLHEAGFTVNYLKTPYRINDQVSLSNSTIQLNNLTITDPKNNKAVANGSVDMRNPLIPDIRVNIDATNFLVLNTTFRDNPLYYGTAYGTGQFAFNGPTDGMNISIQARTEENTHFYIPLNATGTVSDNDFIHFVNHDTLNSQHPQPRLFSGLSMNMDLQITPAAETSLYTDLGELTGRGEGLLSLRVSSLGDFEMFGDYTFNSGKFTFTAQDFINKIFDINQGGNIRWTGQPTDATVNLAAVYGQRTSLGPLYNAAGRETVEQRVLAHAVMNLSGNLMRPDITFALDFPNDPYVKDELQSYLSDANNINQQALSLIVRRSFVPGSEADFSRELNNTLLSAGTELAFNQLNNLISQSLNLKFVDLNIRSLNDASASVRLFNDRLIFTGGVTDRRNLNDLNVFSDRVITDAELLYLIRKDGRLVLRGSNRLNSRNFLPLTNNENYVSALGLVYRQEFYTFDEFLRRLFTIKRKTEEEEENTEIREP